MFARFSLQLHSARSRWSKTNDGGYQGAEASPTEVAGCVKRNVADRPQRQCACIRVYSRSCVRKEGREKERDLGNHPRRANRRPSSSHVLPSWDPFSCPAVRSDSARLRLAPSSLPCKTARRRLTWAMVIRVVCRTPSTMLFRFWTLLARYRDSLIF